MQIPLWLPGETRALALVLLLLFFFFLLPFLHRLKPPVFIPRRRGGALTDRWKSQTAGVRGKLAAHFFIYFFLSKIHIWVNQVRIETVKHGESWEIQRARAGFPRIPLTAPPQPRLPAAFTGSEYSFPHALTSDHPAKRRGTSATEGATEGSRDARLAAPAGV